MRRIAVTGLALISAISFSFPDFVSDAFAGTPATQTSNFSTDQTRDIEKIVHDYLVAHPEVIVEAMRALDEKQASEEKARQENVIAENRKAIYDDPDSFVAGNPNGNVTIVEFFDYQCGYCKRSFEPLMDTLRKDGNVRLVLKEFPILGPESLSATHAAIAAKRQGKYFEFHQAMFRHKGGLTDAKIMEIAASVGIDTAKLRKDMADPAIEKQIERNYDLARALEIKGTPGFIIGDKVTAGALDGAEFAAEVKDARARCGASC